MSLTVLLPSSSFFLNNYLEKTILSGDFSARQLQLGVKLQLPSALIIQRQTTTNGSDLWKRLSRKLAINNGKVAFELATYYLTLQDQQSKETYVEKELQQSIKYWYLQAIRLNYHPAYLALAKYFFKEDKLELALETLKPVMDSNEAFNLRFEIAVSQGDVNFVERHLEQLIIFAENNQSGAEKNSKNHSEKILDLLIRYQVVSKQKLEANFVFGYEGQNAGTLQAERLHAEKKEPVFNSCDVSVQLFATNLHDLIYLEALVTEFRPHPLNNYLCFPPIRYIKISQLECSHHADERIQCRESQWKDLASQIQSRYIGSLLPRGGANVNNGILYLDSQDTVQVFAHEISHLLGFIDEYPLPDNHSACDGPQKRMFAHNVVVLNSFYQGKQKEIRQKILKQVPWYSSIKESTPILQKFKHGWQLGTPESFAGNVGIYLSETCDKQQVQAFKPLYHHTQLRYFEQPFPVEYAIGLKENITEYLMPSFHYNIALSLLSEGKEFDGKEFENEALESEEFEYQVQKLKGEQVQPWLKQAAKLERNEFRRKQILLAEF